MIMAVAYAPEGWMGAMILLAPIVAGIASFWPCARGHWGGPLLALPAFLFALLFTVALFRNGPGYGGWTIMIYCLLLWIVGVAPLLLWRKRR